MKVLGVSGLPGSGKSLISKIGEKKSINVLKMGDIVREEAEKRKTDTGKTAIDLRKEHGDFVLAKIIIKKINDYSNLNKFNKDKLKNKIENKIETNTNDTLHDFFIIEGIRSQSEVDLFKKNFDIFRLVSVFSSPDTRFNRLKNRKRKDDSQNYEEFLKRDYRELNFGIGDVIATSDAIIINENSFNDYKKQVCDFLDNLLDD